MRFQAPAIPCTNKLYLKYLIEYLRTHVLEKEFSRHLRSYLYTRPRHYFPNI